MEELAPQHFPDLFSIAFEPEVRRTWRTNGDLIPPSAWADFLTGPVSYSQTILDERTLEVIGLCELLDHSSSGQHAQLSVFVRSKAETGLAVEAVIRFLNSVFQMFDLNKVYALIHPGAFARVASGRRLLHEDGVLREHVRDASGLLRDVSIFSILRSEFVVLVDRFGLNHLLGLSEEWKSTP
jgi:RimJ/RimL family protein N-acetyltransferase